MEFPLAVQSHEAVLQPAYAQVGSGFARTFVPLPQSGGSYILIAAFVAAILLIAGVYRCTRTAHGTARKETLIVLR